jgi:hypothetical protein
MAFIKISGGKMLTETAIESYERGTREIPQERLEGHSIQKVTHLPSKYETKLELKLVNGERETLYGADADAALTILERSKAE